MPMIVGVILATLYGELNFNDKYFTPIILILSCTIIWLIDVVSKTKAANRNHVAINTFVWIGMKYWAIALAITGAALAIHLA